MCKDRQQFAHCVQSIRAKYFWLKALTTPSTSSGACCFSHDRNSQFSSLRSRESELYTIASTLGQSMETFQKQSMSEDSVNPPCPMLNGNLCSIYQNRPDICRSYPHLEQPEFTSRLMGVIGNLAICPIAFNAFEELKGTLGWARL